MKTSKLSVLWLTTLALCSAVLPAWAQWNQNSGAGPYEYTDPANWVGGTINNLFTTVPADGLVLTFNQDFILTNGVVLGFAGKSNITFRSDSATPRRLDISLGNFLRTNQTGGTITVGTTDSPLVLNLYNHTRSLGGVGNTGSSANSGTMNIYAQIIDTGSNGTNGVNLGVGNMYTYLLNDSNTFTGPVSFGFRGGGFSSIKNIGAGASALGAPLDSTNGTITVSDSTSFGVVAYVGKGDTTDRPFVWNLTGSQFSFENRGSGKLTFTGPWKLPYAANRTNIFTINTISNSIEFDGCLQSDTPTMTNLVFKASWNTNRIILTNPTNNFMALEFTNVVLAFNSISNAGETCALGTNRVLVHRGNASTSNSGNPSGFGACLQYFGPSATNNRVIDISGTGYNWAVENAGTNSTLAYTADLASSFTGSGATPRYLYLNVLNGSTLEMDGVIPDAGGSTATTVVAANPYGYTLNNGGVVRLLNPANTFSGGVQVKYARTLEVATLADTGVPCSIGTGTLFPGGVYPFTGITLGATDSQRGATLAYVGTAPASCNRQITVLGSAQGQANAAFLNNSPNNSSLHLSDASAWQYNVGTATISNCNVTLGGSAIATNILDSSIPNTPLGIANLKINGSIWKLTATHSYVGTTVVSNGTLLLDGAIGTGGDVSVQKNGVLGGTGTINNNVAVLTNGILSPGDFALGTLTINGNLTNSGSIYMELDKSAHTCDQVVGINTLVYGGTLVLTNLTDALTTADSFKLFTATSYLGALASVSPTKPGPGLAWDLSTLASDGTLRVAVGGPETPPQISSVTFSGSNLVISGTNGTPGGTVYVVASTNVSLPMSAWQPVQTNVFDSQGALNVTNALAPGLSQEFFRLKVP